MVLTSEVYVRKENISWYIVISHLLYSKINDVTVCKLMPLVSLNSAYRKTVGLKILAEENLKKTLN